MSDSVKRHLRGRHLSALNLKFDFISDGGCTREEQIALSLKRHLFPHGGREPKAFWICFSRVHPPSEIKSNFKFSGQVRPPQGTEICNFGAPSPLEALHWIFCFFSSVYVQFSKTSPLKSGESSEKSSGENRVKSCHVCGCHGFFGPDFWRTISIFPLKP